jgi:hypothetical protein
VDELSILEAEEISIFVLEPNVILEVKLVGALDDTFTLKDGVCNLELDGRSTVVLEGVSIDLDGISDRSNG